MSGRPLVSAIIPTRDRTGLLERAVASARAQVGALLEVIVIDDGSDPPAAVEEPGVRLIRLLEPSGPAAARNAGIAAARGDFVAFLDDDDEWRPEKTARQLSRMQTVGPTLAGVACGYDLWSGSRFVRRASPPAGDLRRALLENPCLAPSTVLVRRAAVQAVGGFDPALRRCEDWDLWIRLTDRHRIESLAEVLVDRRERLLPPAEAIAAFGAMTGRLAPRIDALPPWEKRKVRAHHQLVKGVLHARIGRRREARALLWSAWRLYRRSPRPLAHLLRTVIGESMWEGAALRARRAGYRIGSRREPRGVPFAD